MLIQNATQNATQNRNHILMRLPLLKVNREKMKSTHENIIDMGIEKGIDRGIFIGKKRGERNLAS
jgi:hypothetical protein